MALLFDGCTGNESNIMIFEPQITELRQFVNHLDEQIVRYKKTGQNTERLQDNKARALATIQKLKQAQNNNGMICRK